MSHDQIRLEEKTKAGTYFYTITFDIHEIEMAAAAGLLAAYKALSAKTQQDDPLCQMAVFSAMLEGAVTAMETRRPDKGRLADESRIALLTELSKVISNTISLDMRTDRAPTV